METKRRWRWIISRILSFQRVSTDISQRHFTWYAGSRLVRGSKDKTGEVRLQGRGLESLLFKNTSSWPVIQTLLSFKCAHIFGWNLFDTHRVVALYSTTHIYLRFEFSFSVVQPDILFWRLDINQGSFLLVGMARCAAEIVSWTRNCEQIDQKGPITYDP